MGWTRRSRQFERDALPHLPVLYRVARQLTSAAAADDLVQETFLRAWKYFETFDSTTNCRAWLFRILRNVWINRWRRSHLELLLAETGEEQVEPYYDWEDEFLRDEMSAEIEHALSDLPADYRLTILLADVEELTYQEIARVMECPIGTVMSRLNRGRKMLARLIRHYDRERSSNEKPAAFSRRKA